MNTISKRIARLRRAVIGITAATLSTAILAAPASAAGGHQGGHGLEFGMPGKAAEVSRTVEIVMEDNFFNHKAISVKAGETVRFKILNKGTLLHEFGLGTAAMHKKHQKQMMVMTEHGMIEADRINHDRMKMDHGGMNMMSHDDPNSLLLEPGKSGEIVWKFTKPMKLEFACNLPGHYEAGMMGPIEFQK
ncbi:MAG: plastocyanin/azurin family copper-binding protein [Rhodospirillales bacterium]